eukprot:snap_masked-scaffold_48-processed-gene-0.3-mRNA-1 protein AED:1.00 eAED:1.00 QI:0/0/0/0/1/1/2/0/127
MDNILLVSRTFSVFPNIEGLVVNAYRQPEMVRLKAVIYFLKDLPLKISSFQGLNLSFAQPILCSFLLQRYLFSLLGSKQSKLMRVNSCFPVSLAIGYFFQGKTTRKECILIGSLFVNSKNINLAAVK